MIAHASSNKVGLVIPTLNAGRKWADSLQSIASQSLSLHRRLVIDSSSNDDTAPRAAAAGFETKSITRAEFNHGGTRQLAVEYLDDCDIVIFLTQDAILASPDSLQEIVNGFKDSRVAVAYGRQLPHKGASAIEAHSRIFNYGDSDVCKDFSIRDRLGAKVYFCSNSFAAYRRTILMKLGGFRRDLILGEDMEFAARSVLGGYANLYCARARAFHSHDYSSIAQFRRYFDLGVFDARNGWMRDKFGSHKGEGFRFVKSELRFLMANAPLQIPRSILQTGAKFVGYRIGFGEALLPLTLKRHFSMSKDFWK